jgi:hypothetical protein
VFLAIFLIIFACNSIREQRGHHDLPSIKGLLQLEYIVFSVLIVNQLANPYKVWSSHIWEQPLQVESQSNSGNACYHSAQNLLSSHHKPEHLQIKIHITAVLSFALYIYMKLGLSP